MHVIDYSGNVCIRSTLLLVLALLTLLSSVRDFQFAGLRCLAGVGVFSYSLYLIHGPVPSILVRLALLFHQPEAVAVAFLVSIPPLAAVAYFRTMESWSLRLTQRAVQRLAPS